MEMYHGYAIDAVRLAGMFDGQYYADIDGKTDFDIKPSKNPMTVINRIKKDYAERFNNEALESVEVIASGYEYTCPNCDSYQKINGLKESVTCQKCNRSFTISEFHDAYD